MPSCPVGTFVMIFDGQNSQLVKINARITVKETAPSGAGPALPKRKSLKTVKFAEVEEVPKRNSNLKHEGTAQISKKLEEPPTRVDKEIPEQVSSDIEEAEERADQALQNALTQVQQFGKPKEKILNDSKPSKSILQEMLDQPYTPPCMTFERPVAAAPQAVRLPGSIQISKAVDSEAQVRKVLELNKERFEK